MRIILCLSLTASAALLFSACKEKPPTPQPAKVQVVTVQPKDIPIYQDWIGTLNGYPNAQIRAQVTGYLIKQDYTEGSTVMQGDLLFEIDPRPFEAVLDQALGKLAQDKAQLGKTELDVKRFTPLVHEQAVSQETLDDSVQANLAAKASITADEAAVETARLNLGFCSIISPVDGIAGIARAQIGDLLSPGGTVLTTVSTVDPMRAYFNIGERSYLTFNRQFTNYAEKTAYRSQMELQLILSDGSTYSRPGKWLFTDRQIDVNTGTIQAAALFPNPDFILRPGQYALVRAKTETRHDVILVPQRAVKELQGAFQVALVTETNTVHLQPVTVGEQIGSDWLIEKGLKPNDRIVVEGQQRATEGAKIDPQPFQGAVARE